MNAGGQSYTVANGYTYEAGRYFSGGDESSTTDPITATDDDVLYQSERWGRGFTYGFLFNVD